MSFADDFERTWTFSELVRALASHSPLSGMTPLSTMPVQADSDPGKRVTAEVIARLIADKKRQAASAAPVCRARRWPTDGG